MTLVLSSLARVHVRVRVSAVINGNATDPTADTVQMAFTAGGAEPDSGDWKTASWETDSTTSPPTYRARCLVGPGGDVTLAKGRYDGWIKVIDTPEIPVRKFDKIVIA